MNKKLKNWFLNSGAFTPSSLSPIVWYDNGSTYMAADGSQWTDRISGKNLTATGAERPTFTAGAINGLPSFTFDGIGNKIYRLPLSGLNGLSGLTIFTVGKRYAFAQDLGVNDRIGILHFTDDNIYANLANGSSSFGQFAFSNNFNYSVMVFDGTQTGNANRLKLWVNGIQRTLTFTNTIPATTTSAGDVLSSGSILDIGVLVGGQANEHSIVPRAITAAEITSLNSYLAAKYAL